MVHINPSIETIKSLAKNSKYKSVRFVFNDHDMAVGDSEYHTHHKLANELGEEPHTMGFVDHIDKPHYWAVDKTTMKIKQNHPRLEKFEKHGISRHPDEQTILKRQLSKGMFQI